MKILIVEDEVIIAEDIAMMLTDRGYAVSAMAMDYDEAIESIQTNPPDLALLDINLKGHKDGIHIAQYINQHLQIPFIYTSTLGNDETIMRAKVTKPATYLIKPFKESQLFAAIEMALINHNPDYSSGTDSEEISLIDSAIFVRHKDLYHKVNIDEIIYCKKVENYIELITRTKNYVIRSTLSDFLVNESVDQFFRCHKSYAINIDYIEKIGTTTVKVGGHEVPIAKNHLDSLKARLRIY